MAVFIQFIGLIGSGKSFVADDLASATNGRRVPFARQVYKLAEQVLCRPVDKSRQDDRELLKLIGTTWGRERSKDLPPGILAKLDARKPKEWGGSEIWVRLFLNECASLSPTVSIFNDDTRFPNELMILSQKEGFVPVFVACRTATRLARLKGRGDSHDANDALHQSEELVNKIRPFVLTQYIIPVVWNDEIEAKPNLEWVWGKMEFRELVVSCANNGELASRLDWDSARLQNLSHWLEKLQGASNV